MKQQTVQLITVCAACLLLVSAQAAAPDAPADAAPANVDLKTRMTALEGRIEAMEKEMRQRKRTMTRLDTRPVVPVPLSVDVRPGRGWVEREINGDKYYLIPLGKQAMRRSISPAKPLSVTR